MPARPNISIAAFRASVAALSIASAATFAAMHRAHASRDPRADAATDTDGVSTSVDRRYRLVGTITPAEQPANTQSKTLGSSRYRLEGAVVGIVENSDEEDVAPRRRGADAALDVLLHWGMCPLSMPVGEACPGDLNADGFVGPDDLMEALHPSHR